MEIVELKIKSTQLRKNFTIIVERPNKTIKEIKEDLGKKIGIRIENIKLLYSSEELKNEKTLKDYDIHNGTTIFTLIKDYKNIKNVSQLKENYNNYNNNDNNIINDENNKTDNNIDDSNKKEESTKFTLDNINLKIYSSIIKILTFENSDSDYINLILNNLKENHNKIYKEICENKDTFIKLLKNDIKKDDIEIYKQYISVAKNLIEKQENDKFNINITNSEEEYIKTWERRGLEKETIILEYVKNKFDEEKTNDYLMKKLSEKNI